MVKVEYRAVRIKLVRADGTKVLADIATAYGKASQQVELSATQYTALDRLARRDPRDIGETNHAAQTASATVVDPLEQAGNELFSTVDLAQFTDALADARRHDDEVEIRLRVLLELPAELRSIPWEILRSKYGYLALSERTPLSRFVTIDSARETLFVRPPLRVLGIVSAPDDLRKLDSDKERQNIEHATQQLRVAGLLEIHWLDKKQATFEQLQEQLGVREWHVIHFVGHGDKTAEGTRLAFVGEHGTADWVRGDELATCANDHPTLRLVMLNCCHGAEAVAGEQVASLAEQLLLVGVPAVVGMQRAVSDKAAIGFAGAFYKSVARGLPIDVAVAAGRKAMQRSGEWFFPVLYMATSVGDLFRIERWRPRWFFQIYVAVAALVVIGIASPFAVHYTETARSEFEADVDRHPGLLAFWPFAALTALGLYQPTCNMLAGLASRDRRTRRLLFGVGLAILLGFPAMATIANHFRNYNADVVLAGRANSWQRAWFAANFATYFGAVLMTLQLMNIVWLFGRWRQQPKRRIPTSVCYWLLFTHTCVMTWVWMRASTALYIKHMGTVAPPIEYDIPALIGNASLFGVFLLCMIGRLRGIWFATVAAAGTALLTASVLFVDRLAPLFAGWTAMFVPFVVLVLFLVFVIIATQNDDRDSWIDNA